MDQQLSRLLNRQYTCTLCRLSWRVPPRSACVGVPRFEYGSWPEGLFTATQLRRMHLKPGLEPDGYYPLVTSPYQRYLYDITKATPRRVPTEKQRGAITKMRAALIQTYTCQGCGRFDGNHGRSRSGVLNGYCGNCWRENHHRTRQADVCAWAKAMLSGDNFVVLDSETTGLDNGDEVIELALIRGCKINGVFGQSKQTMMKMEVEGETNDQREELHDSTRTDGRIVAGMFVLADARRVVRP